ncbi:transglutaminase family protein [Algirhabdus cladophorae]|uniref:transglutaminase family protein n=1 Tax=Algirhabdus cladophorae TaxID=3377108 RepID=UPI003B84AF79
MKLKISHTTTYSYDAPVNYGLQQLRLTPVSSPQQRVLDWSVAIDGGAPELTFNDQYKNHTTLVQVNTGTTSVAVTASGEVETLCSDGVLGKVYGAAPLWHFLQDTPRTTAGRNVKTLAKTVQTGDAALTSLHTLSAQIIEAVPYGLAQTDAATTAEDAFLAGKGVCQDHAQIFIAAARHAGVPARYVSGYLMMNDRVDQDASHAWAEAHVDGLGWVGFDISNGISPDERYVRMATGRDSRDAAPITGMRVGAGLESMIVSLQVQQ